MGLSAGVFEEPGWTGFAIPTLRRRYGVLPTGLIVGIWWSAWHLLPNVWSSRAASGDLAALELDAKFKNLNLGLVDGTVAALAERRKVYRVLTSDRRDFSGIRVGPHFSRPLELLP